MTHIQQRRGTAAEWAADNPVLYVGEIGWEIDTLDGKLGDGVTAWNGLPYLRGVSSVAGKTGVVTLEVVDVSGAAPLASPVFTGNPTAPTPATSDDDTSVATTAFVKAQGYATLASPAFTGNPTAPTPSVGDDDTSVATTGFVKDQEYAPLASPAFTGTPTAPTPASADNDTSVATTEFVKTAMPRGVLGLGQKTTIQGGINEVSTDVSGLTATVTVGASRRIRVSVFLQVSLQTAPNRVFVRIQEGATVLAEAREDLSADHHSPIALSVILAPSAAAHTYKVTAHVLNAGSTMAADVSATAPAYILVEDIGPV